MPKAQHLTLHLQVLPGRLVVHNVSLAVLVHDVRDLLTRAALVDANTGHTDGPGGVTDGQPQVDVVRIHVVAVLHGLHCMCAPPCAGGGCLRFFAHSHALLHGLEAHHGQRDGARTRRLLTPGMQQPSRVILAGTQQLSRVMSPRTQQPSRVISPSTQQPSRVISPNTQQPGKKHASALRTTQLAKAWGCPCKPGKPCPHCCNNICGVPWVQVPWGAGGIQATGWRAEPTS